MASNNSVELDSGATDSVNSTPRSGQISKWNEEGQPRIRFMCSFGGQIEPRLHDNQLRYVGGDTRIVAVHRTCTFASLVSKLSKLAGDSDFTVKYQLPNEDLDALISVTTDEDLENMMEEYDRWVNSSGGSNSKTARLRIFLFSQGSSRNSSISSLLDGRGGAKQWFLDALNGGSASLERGRSEASSIVSEVPDYLFGLDTESDSKTRFNPHLHSEHVSAVSDPGSPAPQVTASPYCSTSSASGIPAALPPVKTKPESPSVAEEAKAGNNQTEPEAAAFHKQQTGYVGNPAWHYVGDPHLQGQPTQPMLVYYMPPGNVPVRPVQVQMPTYMQRIPMRMPAPAQPYHNQMITNQVAGGPMYGQVPQVLRPGDQMMPVPAAETYEIPMGMIGEGGQVLYGQRNPGVISAYPPAGIPVAADQLHLTSSDYAVKER